VTSATGVQPLTINKILRFQGDRATPGIALEVEARNTGETPVAAQIALGWSLNLLGGGGNPSAWYDLGDRRVTFDSTGELDDSTSVAFGNDALGIAVTASASPGGRTWWASVETVSISEDGFERTHQGSSLAFVWPLSLAPGATRSWQVTMSVRATIDHAANEGL
jgi:alpha-amylase